MTLRRWLIRVFLGGGRYHLGECPGCGEFACPKVGPWYARHRDFAFCNDCIPELGEARKKAHRIELARRKP